MRISSPWERPSSPRRRTRSPMRRAASRRGWIGGRRNRCKRKESRTMRLWLIAAALCLCAVAAAAQDVDADGSKDHPMFSRMPGYYIEEYDAQDFSSFELDTEPPKKVEGRYWKISYWVKEGGRRPARCSWRVIMST